MKRPIRKILRALPLGPLPLQPLEPRALLAASITGSVFADLNADGQRSSNEPALPAVTVYLDTNDNQLLDNNELSTLSASDGSYQFNDLPNSAYTVRIITPTSPPNATITSPPPVGFVPAGGSSNPAIGNVSPAGPITLNLLPGQSSTQAVQFTLPSGGVPFYDKIDVLLLMDDTGSFASLAPSLAAQAAAIVASIQSQLPGVSVAIGVARFEDFGGPFGSALYSESPTGRPFILSQPIVATTTADFAQAFSAALARTSPGTGGDAPEAIIEALFQTATGNGIDANNNASTADSGPAGSASTQTSPGSSGDVPAFASFTPDAANHVLAPSGTLGGVGFRQGALPIVLLATESGTAYRSEGLTSITGAGRTLPISNFTSDASRAGTPDFNFDGTPDGAGIQQTITALNNLGALVIGLGTNGDANSAPRQLLESLATVTGAFNRTGQSINAGTDDQLSPNDPLYFRIDPTNAAAVANTIATAVVTAARSAVLTIGVVASDAGAHVTRLTPLATLNAAGQTASFNVQFTHDTPAGRRFDLQFINNDTGEVLGSIPVVYSEYSQGSRYLVTTTTGQPVTGRDFGISATASDLTTRITASTFPALAVPGDTGKITFTITNQGNARATGNIDIKFLLSSDDLLGNDTFISTLSAKSINLAAGASTTITATLTIPAVATSETYRVLVLVDAPGNQTPIGDIAEFSEANNIAASAPLDVAYRFGTFGTRKNVKLTFTDADGTAAIFSMTGPGSGVLTPNENGKPTLAITGNSSKTAVNIAVSKKTRGADGRVTLGDIDADAGSLKSFAAPAINLSGDFTLPTGTLTTLTLADVTGSIALLGGAGTPTITALNLHDASILAPNQAIKTLKLTRWENAAESADHELHALSIKTLTIKGDLIGTQIALGMPAAGPKKSLTTMAVTGKMRDSTLTSAASIGSITIGSLDGSKILVHVADLPAPTLADFTDLTTSLASLTIKNTGSAPSFTNSIVAAATLTKISLAIVDPNSDTPSGLFTHKAASYHRTGIATLKNLTTPGTPDTTGNFTLTIV